MKKNLVLFAKGLVVQGRSLREHLACEKTQASPPDFPTILGGSQLESGGKST
jgi:hypothetical protein